MTRTITSQRKRHQSGYSLVELLVTIGVSTIVIVGAVGLISKMTYESARLQAKSGIQEFRQSVIDLLLNDVALQNTIDGSATMACLKNGTSCTGAGGLVTLFDRQNAAFYDSANTAQGFSPSGVPCPSTQGFVASPNPGNHQCPYRLELTWSPICEPGSCLTPQVLFSGEIKINTEHSAHEQAAGNPTHLKIRIVRNVQTTVVSPIADLQSSRFTTCALFSNMGLGRVKCWGQNTHGLLGRNPGSYATTADFVVDAAGTPISNVIQIAMTDDSACGVTQGGNVLCWGDDYMGVLGRGALDHLVHTSAAPVVIETSPTTVAPLTGIVEAYPLRNGFCARSSANRIYCWGANYQFATPFSLSSNIQHSSWTREWSSVATDITPVLGATPWTTFFAFESTMCVIHGANKELSCWGSNQFGQLGYTPTDSGSVDAAGVIVENCPPSVTRCGIFGNYPFNPNRKIPAVGLTSNPAGDTTVATLQQVKNVSGGEKHLCALLESGEVVCWGFDAHGQVGSGTVTNGGTGAVTPQCLNVQPGVNFSKPEFVRNEYFWKWANCIGGDTNGDGVLRGDPAPPRPTDLMWSWVGGRVQPDPAHPAPAYVVSSSGSGRLSNIVSVSSQFDTTCAIDATGTGYCWGLNWAGQVGTGAPTTLRHGGEPIPRQISVLPAGTRLKKIAPGELHTCALSQEGDVFCWGQNWAGQLGNNSTTESQTAVATQGLDL